MHKVKLVKENCVVSGFPSLIADIWIYICMSNELTYKQV